MITNYGRVAFFFMHKSSGFFPICNIWLSWTTSSIGLNPQPLSRSILLFLRKRLWRIPTDKARPRFFVFRFYWRLISCIPWHCKYICPVSFTINYMIAKNSWKKCPQDRRWMHVYSISRSDHSEEKLKSGRENQSTTYVSNNTIYAWDLRKDGTHRIIK